MNLPLIDPSLKPNPPYQFRFRVNSVDFPEINIVCVQAPNSTYFSPNGIDVFITNPNSSFIVNPDYSWDGFDPCDPSGGDFLADFVTYSGPFCGELGYAAAPGG
ncbi:MAG: hypothetical protein SGI87_06985 [Flavobacteriales bacterium]|nr:hypothetical protein [Flavobacteriales bacterium]